MPSASVSSFTMSDFSEASITTDAATTTIRRHRHEPGVSPCTARSVQRGTYYDLNNDNDNNNNNNANNGQGPSLLHSSMNSLAQQQQQQQQISHRIDMTGTVISSSSSSSRGTTTISIHADEQEGDIENNIQSILNHDNEQAFSNHNGNRHRNNNTTRRHPLAVPPEIQQKIHERRQGELKLFFFIFVISSLGVLVVTLYDIINPK
eukprot:scaffold2821_cov51-Cylindrotheca_fusiformis.AAC.1